MPENKTAAEKRGWKFLKMFSMSSTPTDKQNNTKEPARSKVSFNHLKITVMTILFAYMLTDFTVPLLLMSRKLAPFINAEIFPDIMGITIMGSTIVWIIVSVIYLLFSFITVLFCYNSLLELFLGSITPILLRIGISITESKFPMYWEQEPTLTLLLIYFIIMFISCLIMENATIKRQPKKKFFKELVYDIGTISTLLLLYSFMMLLCGHPICSDSSMNLIKALPILSLCIAGKLNIEDFVPKLSVTPTTTEEKGKDDKKGEDDT